MSEIISANVFEGNIHKLGDDINTDYIISSRRKRDTLDLTILRNYIFEDIDPDFAGRIRKGDILAAGENFGCGSAMEVASFVIKASGIDVVLAESFSRTFYRNGINGGLLLIECETGDIDVSDRLKIEMEEQTVSIRNLTRNTERTAALPGGILLEIFRAGGLVEYIRKNSDFVC
jgi:3-isopropylmalate dehydratase small subunit